VNPATATVAPPDAGTPGPAVAAVPSLELWDGNLEIGGGMHLHLVLHVMKATDGTLSATFYSLDQSPGGIPVDAVTRDAGALAFVIAGLDAEYAGKLNAEGTQALGDFKQHGATIPLTLRKVDKVPDAPARPQTPRPPFPYRTEDVSYRNAAGGVTLAGTLTMPTGDGPFPAAILITGSGAQDRDETLFGHKPFLVIADDLTRKGIAVLRVDDRGVGGSTGSVTTSTSEDFAGDVLAGLAYLETRKEIDPARLGLIGHSEGGLIAPMVAARSKRVAFVVLLAGPGLPGSKLLMLQSAVIGRASGMSEQALTHASEVNERLYAAATSERDPSAAEAKVRAVFKAEQAGALSAKGEAEAEDAVVAQLTSPWFRFFLSYDPRPALAKVTCPLLALNGEKDMQVPPKEDLAEIKKANPRAVTKELAGLNHLFQTAKTGLPGEYAQLEETFAPSALAEISGFILERTKRRSRL
jgi:pimeloyl-ACP methyl ester carboxylesterase